MRERIAYKKYAHYQPANFLLLNKNFKEFFLHILNHKSLSS